VILLPNAKLSLHPDSNFSGVGAVKMYKDLTPNLKYGAFASLAMKDDVSDYTYIQSIKTNYLLYGESS